MAIIPDVQDAWQFMEEKSKGKLPASSNEAKESKKAANESLKTLVRVSTATKIVNLTSH